MQLISIEHRTAYTFSQTVVLKPHRLLLRPRDGFDLRIRSSALSIEPKSNIHWARDGFGNSVAIATFGEKTEQLDILSSVIVEQYQQTTLDTTLLPNLTCRTRSRA
ncbi:MAG: transglutaminase N-terminal domain-containing protein [Candidatus Azotimanducaceae bacterium]